MNRSQSRGSDRIRYAVLCACVVLMTTWVTLTAAGFLAGGMADALVR